MTIPFNTFFSRLLKATDIATQTDLALALRVNRSAVTQAKVRDAVPQKWILTLARRYSLSADWLEFGTGTPGALVAAKDKGKSLNAAVRPRLLRPLPATGDSEELLYVPKASARLCAGGGSFEVDAAPVAEYAMPYRWLSTMGTPASMIFMDVVGSSMEPGIMDGDMVLIDRSRLVPEASAVMAVGVEDAIYLKRVEQRQNSVILHSDNCEYVDITLYGDELAHFRVIGKVVWLCRDCR